MGNDTAQTGIWGSLKRGHYKTNYRYDANGNLEKLNRWAPRSVNGTFQIEQMDSLVYRYNFEGGHKVNNRLRHVNDLQGIEQYGPNPANPGQNMPTGPWTHFDNDLDDQGAYFVQGQPTANPNYLYDPIGNLVKDRAEKIDTILWDNYGKIEAVVRQSNVNRANLYFDYDGMGNRIRKRVVETPASNPVETATWYVRDPQGNVMAVYRTRQDTTWLVEHHLYGADRLGICEEEQIMNIQSGGTDQDLGDGSSKKTTSSLPSKAEVSAKNAYFRLKGCRGYELKNHLGNVLGVVGDLKLGQDTVGNGIAGFYLAEVRSLSDYYPFGSEMSGRSYASGDFRYGFNGKEKDDEWQGSGNSHDFGARIYDSRIGKWLSCDKKESAYPQYSPYLGIGNNPLIFSDPNGEEIVWEIIERENDVPLIKVTVQGKVIDLSRGIWEINLQKSGMVAQKLIRNKVNGPIQFSWEDSPSFELEINLEMEIIEDWDQVNPQDHVMVFAEFSKEKDLRRTVPSSDYTHSVAEDYAADGEIAGITPIYGLISYVDGDLFIGPWDNIFHLGEKAALHELGHWLGIPSTELKGASGLYSTKAATSTMWIRTGVSSEDRAQIYSNLKLMSSKIENEKGKFRLKTNFRNTMDGKPYLGADLWKYIDEDDLDESLNKE